MNQDDIKPIPLQGKIPIKNMHLVRDLQLFNNQQIYVVYDTVIHVYLIDKILNFLPSLAYVLELQPIARKIEQERYQDELTKKIVKNDKSQFGQIVFGQELNPEQNALMSGLCFKERLRFLGNNFLRVKSMNMHPLGHLLIVFQDRRCVILKRNNPLSLNLKYLNLFNTQQPIIINNILQSAIISGIFHKNLQMSLLCIHECKKESKKLTLSRIWQTDKGEMQIYTASKCTIDERGLMKMSYVEGKNGSGWVLLLYYNRLQIIEMGKFNNRNKTFQIFSHKQAEINQANNKEHIINVWEYLTYREQKKIYKLYLLKSASIWELQVIFNEETKENTNSSWNYKLNKSPKQPTTKSNIFYINFQGNFIENPIQPHEYPNFLVNKAVETDNGLLIRLQANPHNYKEGHISLSCQSRVYMVQKSLQCVKAKQHGDILWVNFSDIHYIKKQGEIKKSILKYLNMRTKPKESSQQHPLINIIIINILSITQSKTEFLQNLRKQSIRKHLPSQQFNSAHCAYSNRKIVNEDVVYCPICHLYSIKDQIKIPFCYICWSSLYKLE